MTRIPPECRPIQQELDGIQATIRGLQEELQTAPPAQKPGLIAMIREERRREAEAQTRLDRCIAGADSYLRVAGVECTQAIQYFYHNGQGSGAAQPNSIPLVARKSLVVRVYVASQRHDPPYPTSVSGTLEYRRTGGQAFPVLQPIDAPIPARSAGDIDRGRASHTLNFRIPAAHCVGRLSFTLTLFDPAVPGFETTQPLNPLSFRTVPMLPLHGILIHHTGNGLDLAAPTGQDLVDSLTYLGRTYPISGVQYTGCDEVEFDGDLTSGGDGCGDGWNDLLDMLASMRAASGTDDIFIGLLPSGTPTNRFSGCGRGGVCASMAGAQILMAHEVGHALGRRHVRGCNDPNNVDSNYPRYAGYPAASIGEFGVNADNLAIRDPASTYDFMSYCGSKWISPYTYEALMDRIETTAAAHEVEGAEVRDTVEERLHLNLRVRGQETVELRPSYHLRGPAHPDDYGPVGRFTCELVDAGGHVLMMHRCHHTDPHQDPDGDRVDLHEVLPWHPDTRSVAVRRDGELVGTVDVEPEAPALRVRRQPAAVAAGRPELVRVEWETGAEGSPAAAPGTTYLLRYSHDGGTTWRAVAANLTATGRTVNTDLLPGGEHCCFQVVASSGIRTTTVTTDELRVERKPRRGYLLSPRPGHTVREGEPVVLRGGGFSPDAGTTEFEDVTWSSNRDGRLGVGFEVVTQALSAGRHRITMSFPDGVGGEGAQRVSIDVTPAD